MPSRNLFRMFESDHYYHVYNRGVNKQVIFEDDGDYAVFLNLLKRYLDKEHTNDLKNRAYTNYYNELELLAFCLMPNHFHLFFYQHNEDAITHVMRAVLTSYSRHFNKKYQRIGPLFQSRFKASLITNDKYLMHISRYIHLNPHNYLTWEYSSLPYYLGNKQAEWVRPGRVLEMFELSNYKRFLEDYVDHKRSLKKIQHELADN